MFGLQRLLCAWPRESESSPWKKKTAPERIRMQTNPQFTLKTWEDVSLQAIASRILNFPRCLLLQSKSKSFACGREERIISPQWRGCCVGSWRAPAATKSTVSEVWKPVFESTGMEISLEFFFLFFCPKKPPQTTGLGLLPGLLCYTLT